MLPTAAGSIECFRAESGSSPLAVYLPRRRPSRFGQVVRCRRPEEIAVVTEISTYTIWPSLLMSPYLQVVSVRPVGET